MATPTPSNLPKPPVQTGPRDYFVEANQTFALVNDKNVVCLLKTTPTKIRIFTDWSVYLYADQAAALADIKAKGWTYNPPK